MIGVKVKKSIFLKARITYRLSNHCIGADWDTSASGVACWSSRISQGCSYKVCFCHTSLTLHSRTIPALTIECHFIENNCSGNRQGDKAELSLSGQVIGQDVG